MLDVSWIHENKHLIKIVAKCNNVFDITYCHFLHSLHVKFRSVKILLIVSNLYHEGYIKGLLQIVCHNKGDGMTEMEGLCWGTSSCVEIEEFTLLISVQDKIKVTVTEKDASSDKSVWLLFCEFSNLSLHIWSHGEATKLHKKFFIVNSLISCCLDFKSWHEIFLLDLFLFSFFLLSLGWLRWNSSLHVFMFNNK